MMDTCNQDFSAGNARRPIKENLLLEASHKWCLCPSNVEIESKIETCVSRIVINSKPLTCYIDTVLCFLNNFNGEI